MNFPFDEEKYWSALGAGNVIWRKHTLEKMIVRGISREEVLEVLETGEVIQQYDYDKPFPSALLFGYPDGRPLHVVVSMDESTLSIFVITAYEPGLSIFEPDFRTKRK